MVHNFHIPCQKAVILRPGEKKPMNNSQPRHVGPRPRFRGRGLRIRAPGNVLEGPQAYGACKIHTFYLFRRLRGGRRPSFMAGRRPGGGPGMPRRAPKPRPWPGGGLGWACASCRGACARGLSGSNEIRFLF